MNIFERIEHSLGLLGLYVFITLACICFVSVIFGWIYVLSISPWAAFTTPFVLLLGITIVAYAKK